MPVTNPKRMLTSNLFELTLVDENRYKIVIDGRQELIPFDTTCHYLSVQRTGTELTITIESKRHSFIISDEIIDSLVAFSDKGSILIDKFIFSRKSQVLKKEYYDELMPSIDLISLDDSSFLEWVFAYDTINPRIFTSENAELIEDHYIVPLTMLEGRANTIRNLSKFSIEITYDRGANWVVVDDLEKISPLVPSVLVRSAERDFEFVLDSYEAEGVSIPGATVQIEGAVYPYHRDERTFYTNSDYDFSSATVYITPIDDYHINSIWIYGRVSREIINELGVTEVYCDGKPAELDKINPHVNRLYLLVVDTESEIVLNPQKDKILSINALGTSLIINESYKVEQAFNTFAGNTFISYAETAGELIPGSLDVDNKPFRIIDVQWTI